MNQPQNKLKEENIIELEKKANKNNQIRQNVRQQPKKDKKQMKKQKTLFKKINQDQKNKTVQNDQFEESKIQQKKYQDNIQSLITVQPNQILQLPENIQTNSVLPLNIAHQIQLQKNQLKNKEKKCKQFAIASQLTIKYFSDFNRQKTYPYKKQLNQDSSYLVDLLERHLTQQFQKKNISLQNLRQFLLMFNPKHGVQLPQCFRVQHRIKDASNYGTNRFTFLPNKIVTVQVFRILMDFQRQTILQGPFGISKSTSIVLFCYLGWLITQYNFEYNDFNVGKNIPRIFYLSYKKSEIQNFKELQLKMNILQNQVLQNILSNCPTKLAKQLNEFKKKKNQANQSRILNKIKKISLIYQICKNIYYKFIENGIISKFVLDQFNTFTSIIRQYNDLFYQNEKQKQKLSLEEQIKNAKSQIQQQNTIWISVVKFIAKNVILYSSSQNIQYSVLIKQKNSSKKKSINFNLNHHSPPIIERINYYNLIRQKQGQKQVLTMIFKQIQLIFSEQAKIIKKVEQILEIIAKKNSFINQIQPIIITPFYIRLSFQNRKDIYRQLIIKRLSQQKSQGNFKQIVQKILSLFKQQFIEKSIRLCQNFCFQGKNQDQQKKLSFILRARQSIKEERSYDIDKQFFQFKIDKFQQRTLNRQYIDRNLFHTETDQKSNIVKLQTKFNINDFMQIVQFLDKLIVQKLVKNTLPLKLQTLISYMGKNNSLKGSYINNILVQVIKKYQKFSIEFKLINSNMPKKYTIKKNSQFLHFNYKQNLSIFTRFQKMFKTKNQSIFSYPLTKNYIQSNNSKTIDFIISHIDENNNATIDSFDLTVTSDVNKIKEKCEKAKKIILKIYKDYYKQVNLENQINRSNLPKLIRWNHFIVSNLLEYPQQQSLEQNIRFLNKQSKNINKQQALFTINHANMKQFKVIPDAQISMKDQEQIKKLLGFVQQINQSSKI